MANELSPQLQDIHDRFMVNYAQGGLPAVEQMVADLAPEVDGAHALAGGAKLIEDDAISAQAAISDEDLRDTIRMTHEITRDSRSAMSRHSYASWLLGIVQERQ